MLNEVGKAVLSITTSFAFGTKFSGEEIRKHLVESNYISAVLLLPNLYKDTNTPTLLFVLSKDDVDNILMVDLTKKEKEEAWFYYEKKHAALTPTDKTVSEIKRIERERRTEIGISIIVGKEKIRENTFFDKEHI